MSKITDADFCLPYIVPVTFHEQLQNSANKPLIITGIDKTNGEKEEFVVKLLASERMSYSAFQRELIAAFIANQLDISVVKPAIIDIQQDFVNLLKGKDCWQVGNKSIGYNYGSLYIEGFNILPLGQELSPNQLRYAQNIFAYDMFIQNTDRTVTKPNMLTNGNNIIILDHEIAFGFVFELIVNNNPGNFREIDFRWINDHCLIPLIKGKKCNFDNFISSLDCLNADFWDQAWKLIPAEWRDKDQFDKIRNYLIAVISNKVGFREELLKITS